MATYLVDDSDLTSVANAIRTKGGTSAQLSFPTEFVSAINAIPTGGSSPTISTKTVSNSSADNTSISFTGLTKAPIAFFVRCQTQLTRSSNSSYYYVVTMRYNGTNTRGNYWRMSNGTFYNDTSHYSYTYSNGTLEVKSSAGRSSAGGSFYNGTYELVYIC